MITKLITRILWKLVRSPRVLWGTGFNSWNECDRARTRTSGSSYLSDTLNEEIVADQFRLRTEGDAQFVRGRLAGLLGVAIGSIAPGNKIRVADFGGGAGVHYWEARKIFGDIFEWVVIETESMAALASQAGLNGLTFVANIGAAKTKLGAIDLLLISGSIQYCPEPDQFLAQLEQLEAKIVILRRTPVLRREQAILRHKYWMQSAKYLHHLVSPRIEVSLLNNTAYPVTFLSEEQLARFDKRGQRIFEFSEGPMYELRTLQQPIEGRTVLWIRR